MWQCVAGRQGIGEATLQSPAPHPLSVSRQVLSTFQRKTRSYVGSNVTYQGKCSVKENVLSIEHSLLGYFSSKHVVYCFNDSKVIIIV